MKTLWFVSFWITVWNRRMLPELSALSILLVIAQLLVIQAARTGGLRSPDLAGPTWGPGTECRRRLRRLQGGQGIEAVTPPDLHGDWVSSRCETRPGPGFLTRRYRFHSDLSFTFYQFYYSDNQCQTPAYSYRIRGRLTLGGLSWSLEGATEAVYELDKVTLTVFQDGFAKRLSAQINGSCPEVIAQDEPFVLFRKYVVLDSTRDDSPLDCTPGLAFTMHELQLLRQEIFERRDDDSGLTRRSERLFLGDVHTDVAQMIYYRPKAYQMPLRKFDDDSESHCAVCRIVYNAREHKPPVLPRQQHDNVILRGGWVSTHCEVRPVYFLTRHLLFFDNQTWEGHFHYYKDPLCQFPMYTVSVKGTRTSGNPSVIVEGAFDFRFTSLAMYLTPQSEREVNRFNSKKGQGCGRRGAWKIGKTLDVTSTGGCDVIGIELPHTEFELLKLQDDPELGLLLFNGQRPSDGRSPTREDLRPTSFQSPLVHCSEHGPMDVVYTENAGETNGSRVTIATSNTIFFSILILVINSATKWRL
ncbi:protein APCDD1-like [Diadema setosum]|uniref:protein APCDD1-like n=1 Tax=Diadema setosum TaxID=31175 RepID=UPI003B3B898E